MLRTESTDWPDRNFSVHVSDGPPRSTGPPTHVYLDSADVPPHLIFGSGGAAGKRARAMAPGRPAHVWSVADAGAVPCQMWPGSDDGRNRIVSATPKGWSSSQKTVIGRTRKMAQALYEARVRTAVCTEQGVRNLRVIALPSRAARSGPDLDAATPIACLLFV